MRTFQQRIQRAGSAQELDQIYQDILTSINASIVVRDAALRRWRASKGNRAALLASGNEFKHNVNVIDKLNSLLGDNGPLEMRYIQAAAASQQRATLQQRVTSVVNKLRAKVKKQADSSRLIPSGSPRTVAALTSVSDENYADGRSIVGDPTNPQLSDDAIDLLSVLSEIFDNAQQSGRSSRSVDEGGLTHYDENFLRILQSNGFNRPTLRVSREEFNALAAQGWTYIFRGYGSSSAGGKTPADFANDWIRGTYWASGAGARAYGLGVYHGLSPAFSWWPVNSNQQGGSLSLINPNARFIEHSTEQQMIRRMKMDLAAMKQLGTTPDPNAVNALINGNPLSSLAAQLIIARSQATDVNEIAKLNNALRQFEHMADGWGAILLGYDGTYDSGQRYAMVLNRSALITLDEALSQNDLHPTQNPALNIGNHRTQRPNFSIEQQIPQLASNAA